MKKATFTCTLITPMFVGKVNPDESEINADAIKGGLRFWLRAIGYDKDNDNEIFGSTKEAPKVFISVEKISNSNTVFNDAKEELLIADYLSRRNSIVNLYSYLNYPNAMNKRDGIEISNAHHYKMGSTFSIVFSAYGNDQNVFNPYITALKLLSAFGGIGNRNRNANGQLYIQELGLTWYCIQTLFAHYKTGDEKNYTAFSENARLLYVDNMDSVESAYAALASAYRSARQGVKNCTSHAYVLNGIDFRHDITHRRFIASPANTKKQMKPKLVIH